jgi:hypothetical protein
MRKSTIFSMITKIFRLLKIIPSKMSLIQLISLQPLSQTNQKFLENRLTSRIALI